MFGFLHSPERTCGVEVKSYYQSLFCGVSCQLSSDYGALARFLVNRDSSFLALVGDAVAVETGGCEMKTCCNPLAKKREIMSGGQSLQYTSAVSMCALAVKLEDNVIDDSGAKKYASFLGAKVISRAKDHAVSTLNSMCFPTKKVMLQLASQPEVEATKPSFENAAEPTAKAFSIIMGHHAVIHQQQDLQSALSELGYSLGRLIYWRDAIDDYEQDKRSGAFNPLSYLSPQVLADLTKKELQRLKSLSESIPWVRHGEVIRSIVNHSVENHQDMTTVHGQKLSRKEKRKQRRKAKDKKDSCWDNCCECCDCDDCCPSFGCGCSSCDC